MHTARTRFRISTPSWIIASLLSLILSLLVTSGMAFAQLPVPASSEFDITGFIQVATLGGPGSGSGVGPLQGGFITVNKHVITVPSNTIVILPANALTWQELFAQAPSPYGPTQTGLAMADIPAPLTTWEAHVIGNRVLGGPGGADVYIAGMITISQQALNSGQGFINCINYTNGEIHVGGVLGNCATGTRIRINDPVVPAIGTGRYGRAFTPDQRFMVDQDNPTISSITGFPMCIPRVLADPNIVGNPQDPSCPVSQRPVFGQIPVTQCPAPATAGLLCTSFTMNAPPVAVGAPLDPTVQAPFEVGDYVTYSGTLVQDLTPATPTAGPWPGEPNTYIAAHTIVNNVAIYTVAGTNPAYVRIEVSLIGTGGLTVIGVNEAAVRTRFEGFTSDVDTNVPAGATESPSQRLINLFGIDLNPATGATADRYFGVIGVDPGPPTGAAKGRWRFRPPCATFGTVPLKPDKECVMNQANSFLPPPREVRAVLGVSQDGTKAAAFAAPITPLSPTAANGIVYGQYHAPIADYIFPEQLPGMAPIPENNFNTIPFLAAGGYTSSAGTLARVLDPWPSNVPPPPPPCTVLPTANAGGSYTVASGGSITLNGTGTASDPILSFAWTAALGALSNPALANPLYTAPVVGVQTNDTVTLTVTTCAGASAPNSATVAINAATAPTVNPITPATVFSGQAGILSVTGSDPNVPALVPLTFAAVQAGAPPLNPFTVTQNPPTAATINFTAPALPLTQLTPTTITVTVTATNTANLASAPQSATVTVNPNPDAITVASAEYRTGLKRLIITVNDANPNVTLKLQPYVTTTGATYNPDPAAGGVGNVFTNNLNGTYTLTINGVPAPACGNPTYAIPPPCPLAPLDVISNIQNVPGNSGFFALTRIRQ